MRPKLESTIEYDVFELHELNRELHDSPVLEESMRKHGFRPSCPIHVTRNGGGKLKVKRGHNRLAVAKKLGLPVWYIIDDDDIDIYEWEGDTRHLWSMRDFAVSYLRGGSVDYEKLIDFQKKHGFTFAIAASLVGGESAGSHNKVRQVKSGSFKCGDMTHANKVVRVTDFCREMQVAFATRSGFVTALSMAMRIPEFDVEKFISKIRLYPKMINPRTSSAEYLIEIESLYNYGAKGKRLPVAIRASEVMRERQKKFNSLDRKS
jgi:hypothetical protein